MLAKRKRLIQVNNLNSIANITIYIIYLYYWCKCNILFVEQMKDLFDANEIAIGAKAMRRKLYRKKYFFG